MFVRSGEQGREAEENTFGGRIFQLARSTKDVSGELSIMSLRNSKPVCTGSRPSVGYMFIA